MTRDGRFWLVTLILGGATITLHLLPHGRDVALVKPLASLPVNIGQWHGIDVPMDIRQIQEAAVDDYVNREYRAQDAPPISLYVGYYKSQRTGDSIHSPRNCLPGSGWQPLSTGQLVLDVGKGSPAVVKRYLIQKGLERQLVIYWYQSDHRVEASEFRAKLQLMIGALRRQRTDSALVRISTPLAGGETGEPAEHFATAIFGTLDGLLP